MDDPTIEVSILMPCLNEAETVAACVTKARRWLEGQGVAGEVVVADNGSTDGSQQLASAAGARIVPVAARGYGSALAAGIAAARGRYVIMGDSDDSYDFSDLGAFVAQLRSGAQLVVGNRFAGGIQPGAMPPLHRYLGNPVLSFVGRLFFRSPLRDFHCGLRGFDRDAMLGLGLRTTGMEFASEMIVRATLDGLAVREVPTRLNPAGRSRAPHLRSWRDGWRHLRFLLLYSPRWLFFLPGLGLAAAGLALMALTIRSPLRLPWGALDIHTLLAGGAMVVIGYQAVIFSLLTKVFGIAEGFLPENPRLAWSFRFATLEAGVAAGALQIALALGTAGVALWRWRSAGFGDLVPSQTMRIFIPAVVLGMTGSQTVLGSLFLSVLGLRRR